MNAANSECCPPQASVSPIPIERVRCCEPAGYLQTRGLKLAYRTKLAFDDISLDIGKGCITALVGPSGCGKTSFLCCINRLTDLIPGAQVSGQLSVAGENLLAPNIDILQLRRRVGMIFQKPNPFPLSIWRNMELPLREHGLKDKRELAEKIETALRDVGLWDEVRERLHTPALALSGGQQQRLCIARALALKPEVLLMDEPCSALDPLSSGVVEDLISSLRGKYTVIIVTHNLAQARRIADFVALFWVQDGCGRLVEYADAKQFFERPKSSVTLAYVNGARG